MTPYEAYYKAIDKGYSEELENLVCEDPRVAYLFALDIPGANITKCQKSACRALFWAFFFFRDIPTADVLYCSKYIKRTKETAKFIVKYKPECIEIFKNEDGWKELINQVIIENILT